MVAITRWITTNKWFDHSNQSIFARRSSFALFIDCGHCFISYDRWWGKAQNLAHNYCRRPYDLYKYCSFGLISVVRFSLPPNVNTKIFRSRDLLMMFFFVVGVITALLLGRWITLFFWIFTGQTTTASIW